MVAALFLALCHCFHLLAFWFSMRKEMRYTPAMRLFTWGRPVMRCRRDSVPFRCFSPRRRDWPRHCGPPGYHRGARPRIWRVRLYPCLPVRCVPFSGYLVSLFFTCLPEIVCAGERGGKQSGRSKVCRNLFACIQYAMRGQNIVKTIFERPEGHDGSHRCEGCWTSF